MVDKMKFIHRLEVGGSSLDSKSVLAVDFYIYTVSYVYENNVIKEVNDVCSDDYIFSGRLDWQDGLMIYQNECLEIEHLVPVANYIKDVVIPECIEIIGENYIG